MSSPSILPKVWEVPQIFRDRLGSTVGRQRTMFHEGHLLLVAHEPPQVDEFERRGEFFWREPNGTWHSGNGRPGIDGLRTHIEEYASRLNEVSEQEEKVQTSDELFVLIEELAPLQRATRNMFTILQEARELVKEDRAIIDFRDRAYELTRQSDLLSQQLQAALDYRLAKQAEEQARASHEMAIAAHRLNSLAAFFLPIATISSVFGASLKHQMEDYLPPWPFVGMVVVGLVAGVVLWLTLMRPSPKK